MKACTSLSLFVNSHVPRSVYALAGDRPNYIAVPIQDQQAARPCCAAQPLGAGKTAHQNETGMKNVQRGRQARLLRVALEEDRPVPVRLADSP
jgi:hypothetical protein